MGQRNIRFIEILKLHERDDALCHSVNIDWIGSIMKIPDSAIGAEEVRTVKLETSIDTWIEFLCIERLSD
jgi:hypothetical protein